MFRAMLFKEFLLILRDRHAMAALFVMPAMFVLIMSLVLKDAFDETRAVAVCSIKDMDHSEQSRQLVGYLEKNRLVDIVDANKSDTKPVRFVLTIPKGFAGVPGGKETNGTAVQIDVAADVKQELLSLFKMQVATAVMQVRIATVRKELARFSDAAAKALDGVRFDEDMMLQVRFEAMQEGEHPTSTQQSVPSWIVFGMFFIIIPMSTIFIGERKQNTLMRLAVMDVSTRVLFAGKIIPYLVVNQLQVWVMIAVGMFVVPLFGADALTLGDSPAALLLVSFALSLAAIGTSMLVAVSVSSVEQATTIGGIFNILLGAIGGIMVPKFVMPDFMQTFSNVSPMSWGLEGFLDVFLRREGVHAVMGEVTALALFAAVSLLAAGTVFKLKSRRGM